MLQPERSNFVALSGRETLAVGAVSLVAAAAGMPVFLRGARRLGLLDAPNARSAHARPTPRGGGLVLLVAAAVALRFEGTARRRTPPDTSSTKRLNDS